MGTTVRTCLYLLVDKFVTSHVIAKSDQFHNRAILLPRGIHIAPLSSGKTVFMAVNKSRQ